MVGKCELKAYMTAHPEHLDYAGGTGFAALRDSYADTRYYVEPIGECRLLREIPGKEQGWTMRRQSVQPVG